MKIGYFTMGDEMENSSNENKMVAYFYEWNVTKAKGHRRFL